MEGLVNQSGVSAIADAEAANKPLTSVLKARRLRGKLIVGVLLLLLVGAMVAGVTLGAVKVELPDLLQALGFPSGRGGPLEASTKAIVVKLRLPRVLLSALVGAALATAGTIFQALFRNPMADPYILGVSAGAALGASVAFLFPMSLTPLGVSLVPVAAFAGAIITVILVGRLARSGDYVSLHNMLLSGIAVGAFFMALVSLLMYFSRRQLQQVIFWLMGGFDRASWSHFRLALPYFALGLAVTLIHARVLNALLLGEETAANLGVEVEQVKKQLLVGASLLTATAVAVSGPIGFVGLIVPHALRILVGPDHRLLLPASALGGAVLMVAADTLARTIIAPTELPVGLIMSLGGAPFFISLIRGQKRKTV